MQIDYKMFYTILVEAEARAIDARLDDGARARSQETVSLCLERMKREGLTRADLKRGYKVEALEAETFGRQSVSIRKGRKMRSTDAR